MNKTKGLSVKTIVAIGIGAAVFIILARFASIPTFLPNTEIQIVYSFLALMSVVYGLRAGLYIGLIGHTLKDVIFYGNPWFSWVIASGVVGLIIGASKNRIKIEEGVFGVKKVIIFNIYQMTANILAWLVVAPCLDILIYGEPVNKVFLQGMFAGLSNVISVGVVGTIILASYSKTKIKKNSLKMEE